MPLKALSRLVHIADACSMSRGAEPNSIMQSLTSWLDIDFSWLTGKPDPAPAATTASQLKAG